MLENPKAARVKRATALVRKKERLAAGRFLVEGPQSVRELLRHRPELVEVVYATMGTEPWQHDIDRLASAGGVTLERATPQVLAAMAETVQPQGVIAIAAIEHASLEQVCEGARLIAILHEVRDPGNAGTVLRAADAAGADAVIFSGESIDPWHPKVVRATTGSLFHLPVAVAASLDSAVTAARNAQLSVYAADVHGEELTATGGALATPVAWVFGNEARGLTAAERALTDRAWRLPIYGQAESLNLATAASVLLYHTAFAQREGA